MKLSESKVKELLLEVDGWEYQENALHTTFEFAHFKDAFSVMTRIAFEAEILNHHPNWTNVYNRLEISLTTHDMDGVTEKDFALAKIIDEIAAGE